MDTIISAVSLILSALCLFISALSVFYSATLKSYEILINKRMQTYQEIKDCFHKLRGLTKEYEIAKYCGQDRAKEYCKKLREKYYQLESLLSKTESPEFYLLDQVKELTEMAMRKCNSTQKCSSMDALKREAEITFLFADIYCWTLWIYIQGLHKIRWRVLSYHRMFNITFKKIYKRTKRLHPEAVFFQKYPLDKILI